MSEDTEDPLLAWGSFLENVEKATSRPGIGYGNAGSEGFNMAGRHVLTLLQDAATAYGAGSFGTATFLAITALEETAKADMLSFRRDKGDQAKPKGRDPLRDHVAKHRIAVRPTVWMGERLVKAIGRDRCLAIKAEIEAGGLTELREASLYVSFGDRAITSPATAVEQPRAREILLIAIEAADDILIGSTNGSWDWKDPLEVLFGVVS